MGYSDAIIVSCKYVQEYVSCPSCGRTLFDLQDVSAEIREKTDHLPGVSVCKMQPDLFLECGILRL